MHVSPRHVITDGILEGQWGDKSVPHVTAATIELQAER